MKFIAELQSEIETIQLNIEELKKEVDD